MSTGTVITFYSYKGGVGRTLALANVGVLLAQWNYRVLCVDWDLEAPGLHHYLNTNRNEPQSCGLIDLVTDITQGKIPDWHNYITQVNVDGADVGNRLSLLHAGRDDGSYVQRLQVIRWDELYAQHNFGEWLESVRSDWKKEFDFVLIDSRTGITDIGGICTIQMPDILAMVFNANHQSLEGVCDVALRAQEQQSRLPVDRSQLLCLPIPSRFEGRVEYELAQEWLNRFAKKLGSLYTNWLPTPVTPLDILSQVKIPYVPYWSFGEKLPVIKENAQDPDSLSYSMETLAALLADRLANVSRLFDSRDDYVNGYRRAGISTGHFVDGKAATGIKPLRVHWIYADDALVQANGALGWLNSLVQTGEIFVTSRHQVDLGHPWRIAISVMIDHAEVVVVFVTPALVASGVNEFEIARSIVAAGEGRIVLIPVWLMPINEVLGEFANTSVSRSFYGNLAEFQGLELAVGVFDALTLRTEPSSPSLWKPLVSALRRIVREKRGQHTRLEGDPATHRPESTVAVLVAQPVSDGPTDPPP